MIARLVRTVRELPAALPLLVSMSSYLRQTGWLASRRSRAPIDDDGEPIPWMTYASLHFMQQRLKRDMNVFEYGSGSSTLWWARKVRHVVSCEHDLVWYERTRSTLPQNVDLKHVSLGDGAYAREILKYTCEFDIVVIDGRDRVNCARNAISALKRDGVIIWDNSERMSYEQGFAFLVQNGFRRVDFAGLGPINVYQWVTSIFYRDGNCLGL